MNKKTFEELYFKILKLSKLFSEIVGKEGIKGLENEIYDMDIEFFRTGISLMVEGADAKFLNKYLSNLIDQEKNKYERKLKTIQKEAVLMIQTGTEAMFLIKMLSSYVNEELRNKTEKWWYDLTEK